MGMASLRRHRAEAEAAAHATPQAPALPAFISREEHEAALGALRAELRPQGPGGEVVFPFAVDAGELEKALAEITARMEAQEVRHQKELESLRAVHASELEAAKAAAVEEILAAQADHGTPEQPVDAEPGDGAAPECAQPEPVAVKTDDSAPADASATTEEGKPAAADAETVPEGRRGRRSAGR